MSVDFKLIVLVFLNIISILYLIYKLINMGNTFNDSLRLAWDLIIGETKDNMDTSIYSSILWVSIIRKTWWLTLFLYSVYWLFTEELFITIGLILLVIFHFIWYLYAIVSLKTNYNRILHLNSNWGIIYQEIPKTSGLVQKSLAELDLRKKNLLVLAIERNEQVNPFPKGLEIIQAGDRVVMFGDLTAHQAVFD